MVKAWQIHFDEGHLTVHEQRLHFERRFQVWYYTVGHSRLLLRSPKTETQQTRVDVLFKDVAALNLPTLMDGITVELADEATTQDLAGRLGASSLRDRRVFSVRGNDYEGYVVAGIMVQAEDTLEYDAPSSLLT